MHGEENDLDVLERDLTAAARHPHELDDVRRTMELLRRPAPTLHDAGKSVPRMPRPGIQRPYAKFQELSAGRMVRLLIGAVVFVALCISLILLVFPLGNIVQGRFGLETLLSLFLVLGLVGLLSALLYLLCRAPRADRKTARQDPMVQQFIRQKRLFQVSALSLLTIVIVVTGLAHQFTGEAPFVPFVAVGAFFFGYWLLGRRFWRCPACGWKLSFMIKSRDRQSVRNCPRCQTRLQ